MSILKTLLRWNWKFHVSVIIVSIVVIVICLSVYFSLDQARHNSFVEPIGSVREAYIATAEYVHFMRARPGNHKQDIYMRNLLSRVVHSKTHVDVACTMISILYGTSVEKSFILNEPWVVEAAEHLIIYLSAFCFVGGVNEFQL